MTLEEKLASLPPQPGVYIFRDAGATVLYVGKALSLRSRVRSYFAESRDAHPKTDALVRQIADLETIIVDNEREALALENNLIKQHKPKYNILLRDDKTYPYIKYTAYEKYPRVYVTRRLKKDGSIYFGPYFPASLAYRIVHLIHKWFKVPSCTVDLTRAHPRPCLQYHIYRCLGPCVTGLTTDQRYAQAARDVRMFLEGRRRDLVASLEQRMQRASREEMFEEAASLRDLIRTLEDVDERQKMASAEGDDTDVLAWYAEPPLVAVNLFHLRRGRVVDRRDFYWEDQQDFDPAEFLPALLKQIYLDSGYQPRYLHVPLDFEDRRPLEEILSERGGRRVEILAPQRGQKRALLELVEKNAKNSFEQRFRVLKPNAEAVAEALETALGLPGLPRRIECFDVSHIQGSDTVASLVVWENGRLKKSDYRKFIIRGVTGNDDFASLREAVERRFRRLRDEKKPLPDLLLIDGGIGQLHAAAQALDALEVINQPLASIAKKEEIIYVHGQEQSPIVLERHSPILHLVQLIRDETHRFAVTFHRQRRAARQRHSELEDIPGVGERTARRLLRHFGSVTRVRAAEMADLERVVNRAQARRVFDHLRAANSKTPVTG
jgi:excinuclease ABC subunit C